MLAGAKRIYAVDELHEITGVHDAAVWAEIARAVLDETARQEDAREVLGGHAYPRICLRVLQEYVVAGLELLDEIVLQQQGIRLRLYHRILRVGNLRHHHGSLPRQPLGRHEILRNPLMQVLCLTHINHIPLGVIIPVDTRGMRKKRYLFSNGHNSVQIYIKEK